jgi:hypothetical protein
MGFSTNDSHVRGDLFNESGKWKYTVALDYGFPGFNYTSWDLWKQARLALAHATAKGVSGVSMLQVPKGWSLIVLEPCGEYSHPITVHHTD